MLLYHSDLIDITQITITFYFYHLILSESSLWIYYFIYKTDVTDIDILVTLTFLNYVSQLLNKFVSPQRRVLT
jgi:hypothetical protein